jgi:hypothetical protein
MDAERAVEKAIAFLEPARTAIDGAELAFVGSLTSEHPARQLVKGQSMLEVAARNVKFCSECILEIAQQLAREADNGASVDGVSAGRTVVPTAEVGRDQVPSSAASASKH